MAAIPRIDERSMIMQPTGLREPLDPDRKALPHPLQSLLHVMQFFLGSLVFDRVGVPHHPASRAATQRLV